MSDPTTDNNHGIILSERAYDVLKDLDLIALPALGTAYGALATLYSWGFVTQVVGTVAVVVTLIGILLKISNVQYKAAVKVADARAITAAVVASSATPVTQNFITPASSGPETPGTVSQN